MKYLKFVAFFLMIILSSCGQNKGIKELEANVVPVKTAEPLHISNIKGVQIKDKAQIQTLIREMLIWSGSDNSINLLPALMGEKDSICRGFDLRLLKENLEKLKATNFFSADFLNNYNRIILTLDKKIRDGEISKWSSADWKNFSYRFNVRKENHQWKISYLQGFDFMESTKAGG